MKRNILKLIIIMCVAGVFAFSLSFLPDIAHVKDTHAGSDLGVSSDFAKTTQKYVDSFIKSLKTAFLKVTDTSGISVSDLESEKSTLEVHFLDVGQGDCVLILAPTKAALIDAGLYTYGESITEYIDKQLEIKNLNKLDYVFLTHPDADHVGGFSTIFATNDFEIGEIYECGFERTDSETMYYVEKAMKENGLTPKESSLSDTYSLGDNATISVVGPVTEYEECNDNSLVLRLDHGENSYLFTGDAENMSENDMIYAGCNLDADVLKVAHHGSNTSTSEQFVAVVSPDYAIISVGEGNDYFHPHAGPLNILRHSGVHLFRTDEQGTIISTSDGNNIIFNTPPSEDWSTGN